MSKKNYKIFIQMDYEETKALKRALTLFKVSSAVLDYAENIEVCEMLENKLEKCLHIA